MIAGGTPTTLALKVSTGLRITVRDVAEAHVVAGVVPEPRQRTSPCPVGGGLCGAVHVNVMEPGPVMLRRWGLQDAVARNHRRPPVLVTVGASGVIR